MNRVRKKRYHHLREIRQERDYQIGLLQYANRPYSLPSLTVRGRKRPALTTKKFMKTFLSMSKGVKILSPSETKGLLAQNKIPTYKCNVKK